MLERLENLSAAIRQSAPLHEFGGRLHALWLTAVGALALACLWLAVCPMITSKGQRYALCLCMCRRRGWRFLLIASFLPALWRLCCAIHWVIWQRARRTGGRGFTLVALVTGALWGQPMWGTWWVWDTRLTSVLVLLFIYLGYIALWEAIDDYGRRRAPSILAVVGFVNVPIVKFSVDWWNTLHQPASVSRFARPALHADFLYSAFGHGVAFLLLFLAITLTRLQMEVLRQRLRVRQSELSKLGRGPG